MSTDATAEPVLAQDTEILFLLQKRMEVVRQEDPEWFAGFEDGDPYTASVSTLRQMISTAPTDFVLGVLVGIYTIRQQIAILTERPFE